MPGVESVQHHIVPAGLPQPDTQFHIVIGHLQILREAPGLLESVTPYHETGPGHRCRIAVQAAITIIFLLAVPGKLQLVHRPSGQVGDTRMLNHGGVRIVEFQSHRSHIGPQRPLRHGLQPAVRAHRDIIIEKKQNFSCGLPGAQVAHFRKIKGHGLIDISHAPGQFFYFRPVFGAAPVVHHQNLPGTEPTLRAVGPRICRNVGLAAGFPTFFQRLQTLPQDFGIILGRNDNG